MTTETEKQPNPGAQLKAAREKQGLKLQDVYERLKISPHHLEALEKQHFDPKTINIYLHGYLRNYCRLLGLSPDKILNEFKALGFFNPQTDTQPPTIQLPTPTKLNPAALSIMLICLAISGWLISHYYTTQKKPVTQPITNISSDDVPFKLDNPVESI